MPDLINRWKSIPKATLKATATANGEWKVARTLSKIDSADVPRDPDRTPSDLSNEFSLSLQASIVLLQRTDL